MKYNIVDIITGEIASYDTNDNYVTEDKIDTDREKLDSIDDKVIESYIREKKLNNIKKSK